jgi:IS30 family transposase
MQHVILIKKNEVLEMKQRSRIYYSDEQKSIMWDRWQKGDSLNNIARLFDRNHSSISRILSLSGGIRPPKRTRSSQALSLSEREEISRGIASHESLRSIAYRLVRAPSTISREVKRNDGD